MDASRKQGLKMADYEKQIAGILGIAYNVNLTDTNLSEEAIAIYSAIKGAITSGKIAKEVMCAIMVDSFDIADWGIILGDLSGFAEKEHKDYMQNKLIPAQQSADRDTVRRILKITLQAMESKMQYEAEKASNRFSSLVDDLLKD